MTKLSPPASLVFPLPSKPLGFTGERYVSGLTGPIHHEHYHRYLFAAPLCEGRDVLDIACGEGYGSALLGQVARTVVGADIDPETASFAQRNYGSETVRFLASSATRIALAPQSVDVVVSFETIEHFAEHEAFLAEIGRVLRPDGLLVISSPNRPVYTDRNNHHNEFHLKELDREEFRSLLAASFPNVKLLEQRSVFGSVLMAEEGWASAVEGLDSTDGRTYSRDKGTPSTHYFLALASAAELPAVPHSILNNDAYLREETEKLAAEIGRAVHAEEHAVGLAREVTVRDTEIERLNAEMGRLSEAHAGVSAALQTETARVADRDAEIALLGAAFHRTMAALRQQEVEAGRIRAQHAELSVAASGAHAQAASFSNEIAAMRASTSWRVATPVRVTGRTVRRVVAGRIQRKLAQIAWWIATGQFSARWAERRAARFVNRSGALDQDWYLANNPDITAVGIEPTLHFLRYGAAEGRNPNPRFQIKLYRERHPELPAGQNALLDALRHGRIGDGFRASRHRRAPRLDLSSIIFAPTTQPDLSVIVDARGGEEQTTAALSALLADNAATVEVLVMVEPGSRLTVTGARRIVADGSVPDSINRAVAEAKGRAVIFVGSGIEPMPGALSRLRHALDCDPDIGLVCGSVVENDDQLISAGGQIEADGTPVPRGKGYDDEDYRFASRADVEWAPPGLLAIAPQTWQAAGGLGPQFPEPHAAWADLALKMRARGMRIVCVPAAAAFGEPEAAAIPASDLALLVSRQSDPALRAASVRKKPKVLFVDALTPRPDHDSGSVDIFNSMKIFLALGYEVTFMAAFDMTPDGRYTAELRDLGVICVTNPPIGWPEAFVERHAHEYDVALLYRWTVADRLIDILRRVSPRTRIIFNTVDLHFLRGEREARLHGSAELMVEAYRSRVIELSLMEKADCTILLSHAEQELIHGLLPAAKTCLIPILRDVPGLAAPLAGRRGVVFVGGFAHLPNIDAIIWFVGNVWPHVRARLPDALLEIIGSSATDEVKALHDPANGIEMRGFVEKIEPVLAACRLTVAPLRYGAGIKGKIVSSLANGVPCVATSIAVEGMGLVAGSEALVADDPQAMAAEIVRLCEDDGLWHQLSDAGVAFARANFSCERVQELIVGMLDSLDLPVSATVEGETGKERLRQRA